MKWDRISVLIDKIKDDIEVQGLVTVLQHVCGY